MPAAFAEKVTLLAPEIALPSLYQLLPVVVLLVSSKLAPTQKLVPIDVMMGAVGLSVTTILPVELVAHPPVKLIE
jgi:hypothetical protein